MTARTPRGPRRARRYRLLAALVPLLCGAAALTPATVLATVTITAQPPPGAVVSTIDSPPHYFRTADPQPTIGIQADGGAQIRCAGDGSPEDVGPCGPALPGCSAALCASYRPSAPLAGRPASNYDLFVDVVDAGGHELTETQQGFAVDETPPAVAIDSLDRSNPLRPVFGFSYSDDQPSAGYIDVNDTVTCSLVPLGRAPRWGRCPASRDSESQGAATYRVPRRHADYRFSVRAVDDFGRATIAHRDYDPVPCALHVRAPRRLSTVASSGVPVTVNCSFVGSVDVGIWPMAVNGRVYTRSPARTVATRLLLGGLRLHGRRNHWSARRRLRLSREFVGQARRFHSTRFLVTACPGTDSCADRALDASWSYVTFTAR